MLEDNVWQKVVMSSDNSIRDAFLVLNNERLGIALITDSGGILKGTVTDGDIRRGLLKGLTLESKLTEVLNSNPILADKNFNMRDVFNIMSKYKISQVPIVDKDMKLLGLHLMEEKVFPSTRANTVVIMAGGRGTRLLPFTEATPKPMLLVSGKPILENIIVQARNQGFKNFILAINYLGNIIEEYFGDGSFLDVNIKYVKETTPLGTAGALALLNPAPQDDLVVLNGDVISDINYADLLDFHLQNQAAGTMAVQPFEWINPYGIVQTEELEIIDFHEKPTMKFLINAGIYALSPMSLNLIKNSAPLQMPDLFIEIRKEGGKTIVYPVHEKWIDVGSKESLSEAMQFFDKT
jgi:dTDP-glucose pyrophosphorylase